MSKIDKNAYRPDIGGLVSVVGSGVIVKDPITAVGNMAAKTKDLLLNDIDKGVWIGKRPIGGTMVGFSTYAL